jgi:hypothetical protein
MELSMSSFLKKIHLYRKERLKIIPWLFVPVILFLIGDDSNNLFKLNFNMLLIISIGVVFFRVFDDVFCSPYDKLMGKQHDYLLNGVGPMVYIGALLGAIFLFLLTFYYGLNTSLFGLLFIIVNFGLYQILATKRPVIFISMLKYPYLLLLSSYPEYESQYIWVVIGTLFFVGREILEEIFKIRNAKIEFVIITLIIILKFNI